MSQHPVESAGRRSTVWLERLLIVAFVLCILVGGLALAALLTLRSEQPAPIMAQPLAALRSAQVQAPLALRQLAGDPATGLATQAIQAGYLETARAILLYETDTSSLLRANQLVQLGRAYLDAGDAEAAAQTLRLVLPAAILGANLPSLERAQLLSQAAEGLLAADARPAALAAAQQAVAVASQAPDLLPAQRSQIFNQLVRLAPGLADKQFRQQVTDLARNPFLTPTGILITSALATFTQLPPYDEPTRTAMEARHRAAALFADRIALTNGVDIELERQGLEQALLAEDQARSVLYAAALAGGLTIDLPQQTGLLLDQLAWQATKVRIADRAFGLGIVPAWEQEHDALVAAFDDTLAKVRTLLDAHAAALPAPIEQAMQRVANQYWLAEYAERGLSSAAPADLAEQIRIAQDELAREGSGAALPIIYVADAPPPGFRIQTASPDNP